MQDRGSSPACRAVAPATHRPRTLGCMNTDQCLLPGALQSPLGLMSNMMVQDVELTQTQVVASQHTRQRAAWKDHDVHARLTSLTDANFCFEFTKEQSSVQIGRHPSCPIRVHDKRASSVHLRIYREVRGDNCLYFVEELSPNGCFINKHFMVKGDTRQLHHGDEVSLCIYARSKEEKAFAAFTFSRVDSEAQAAVASSSERGTCDANGFVTEVVVANTWDMRTILGQGNFSEVRLGVHVATGVQRAVKVINKKSFQQFQKKRDSRLSFKSEAETLASLSHNGIVRVFDWFETESHLYLAMELVSDGDLLHAILEHGCFTEPQARRLFRQLCEAVRYLHNKNIVHRDLKPENILCLGKDRSTMSLKIADFGLAWKNMKSGDCQTFCGTPHYLSPEVINTFHDRSAGHAAGYGKQVDMWSLGVILYVMLSGAPPFEDDGLYEQILEAKFEFDVREWTAVSPEAKELVRRLMCVNKSERLTIEQTLDHQWLRFSPPSSPPRAAEAPCPKRQRHSEDMDTADVLAAGAVAGSLGA